MDESVLRYLTFLSDWNEDIAESSLDHYSFDILLF